MKTDDLMPTRPTVSPEDFRDAMSRLPTAVSVITTRGADGPVGCTANAVMSLSVNPPSMLLSLTTGSRTLAHILSEGRFAVNVLSCADHELTRQFATGTAAERFAGVAWDSIDGVPLLTRSSASVVCTVQESTRMLDHTLVIGTVDRAQAGEAPPSVLYRNRQYALGPDLGR